MVKKSDYNTKVTKIKNKLNNHNHDKYIDTSEFNKLAVDIFNARIAQANLMTETDFDAKLPGLNKKITQNKTKHLLVENELKTFDSSYFIGKSHFEEDGVQNYLVFQPLNKYLKGIAITNYFSSRQSKGLFDETIKTHPALINCLFGAVIITKNADIDNCKYSGYGIGFDRTGFYLLPDGSFGRNVVIFGVDMSSSAHVDNKGRDILILGTRPTQRLGEHSLTEKKCIRLIFLITAKNVV